MRAWVWCGFASLLVAVGTLWGAGLVRPFRASGTVGVYACGWLGVIYQPNYPGVQVLAYWDTRHCEMLGALMVHSDGVMLQSPGNPAWRPAAIRQVVVPYPILATLFVLGIVAWKIRTRERRDAHAHPLASPD